MQIYYSGDCSFLSKICLNVPHTIDIDESALAQLLIFASNKYG
jgi:hypothetical protein